jgi:hypothetical protein
MSDRSSTSPPPVNGTLPESRLVQETSQALGAFYVEALNQLQGKLHDVLQPPERPISGPLRALTDELIRQLRERVDDALNTKGVNIRGAHPTGEAKPDDPPLRDGP